MFLFKSAGATYRKVIDQKRHAFQYSPSEVNGDELILLSKNKEDCELLERQVQAVAKLDDVRPATVEELDRFFPGVAASKRWNYVIELYWVRRLSTPFNLFGIKGFNAKRYNPVQGFAKLDPGDDVAMIRHLAKTNPSVLLDLVNNSESEMAHKRAEARGSSE